MNTITSTKTEAPEWLLGERWEKACQVPFSRAPFARPQWWPAPLQRFSTTVEIRLLAAHGMQCPLDALGIARDDSEVGFGRLVGLRAALFPIPQSSKRDSESCGKFLLSQREGAAGSVVSV